MAEEGILTQYAVYELFNEGRVVPLTPGAGGFEGRAVENVGWGTRKAAESWARGVGAVGPDYKVDVFDPESPITVRVATATFNVFVSPYETKESARAAIDEVLVEAMEGAQDRLSLTPFGETRVY